MAASEYPYARLLLAAGSGNDTLRRLLRLLRPDDPGAARARDRARVAAAALARAHPQERMRARARALATRTARRRAAAAEGASGRARARAAPAAHQVAALTLQRWWLERRPAVATENDRRKRAADPEFAAFRERREEPTVPQQIGAATSLQRWWKGRLGCRRVLEQRGRQLAAARIQGGWRMRQARMHADGIKEYKRAVFQCGQGIKIIIATRIIRRRQHLRMNCGRAVHRIRALLHGARARRMLRDWRRAAGTLTRAWRRHGQVIARRKHEGRRAEAATKIQSLFRGHRARARVVVHKRESGRKQHFATRLQCVLRGMWTRRRLQRQCAAACTMQRAWRCCLSKLRVQRMKVWTAAAKVIQRWWRYHLWQYRAYARFQAVQRVQAVWRGYWARRRLELELTAAVKMQRMYRGCTARQVALNLRRGIYGTAAIICQALMRGALARSRLQRQFLAARSIQRWARRILERMRLRAVRCLQKMWRGVLQRRLVRSYADRTDERRRIVRGEAASQLATWWRGCAARLWVSRAQAAARRLQRGERVRQARRSVAFERMRRNRAAWMFQRCWRGWSSPGGRRDKRRRRAASIAIQRVFRGHLIRSAVARKWAAAAAIQTAWRFQKRKSHRAARAAGAKAIQERWRAHAEQMRVVEEANQREAAAIRIQSQVRARFGRKEFRLKRDAKRRQLADDERLMRHRERCAAAAAIQARWRGVTTRKWYREYRMGLVPLGREPMRLPTLEWYSPSRARLELAVPGDLTEQQLTLFGPKALERPGTTPIPFPTYDPSLVSAEQRSLAASLPAMGTAEFAASALPEPGRAQTPSPAAPPRPDETANSSIQGLTQSLSQGATGTWERLPVTAPSAAWAVQEVSSPGAALAADPALSPAGRLIVAKEDRPHSLQEDLAADRDHLAVTIHQAHWRLMQVNHQLFMHQAERRRLQRAREYRRNEQAQMSQRERGFRTRAQQELAAHRAWAQAAERFVLEETMQRSRVKEEERSRRSIIATAAADVSARRWPTRRRQKLGALVSPLGGQEHRRRPMPDYLRRLLHDGPDTPQPLIFLDLNRQGLTDVSVYPVLRALETNETLQELHLDYNRITDASCAPLAEVLHASRGLQRVSLRGNPITDAGGQLLLAALQRPRPRGCCALRAVDLGETPLSAGLCAAIEAAVADIVVGQLRRSSDAKQAPAAGAAAPAADAASPAAGADP
eukprot:TRINITY_DN26573_c0_g1_i1.p1 TRINITY_DN26573_c0_g1~~TRINITY_DN26573_c0_g1_i1.p1  ORF type:complete len:1204 (+),score=335.48 TRINITY_DN26573_c0_g1_i1:78-3689(+)